MKSRFLHILIISCIVCIVSACCGFVKGGCNETNGIYYIYYNNFDKSELDSVYLLKYKKNTNFSELLDSVKIRVDSNSNNYHQINTNLFISTDSNYILKSTNDYKIFIKDINKTFQISEITIQNKSCKSCPGSIKQTLIGIIRLKQDNIIIEIPNNSGFVNEITITK